MIRVAPQQRGKQAEQERKNLSNGAGFLPRNPFVKFATPTLAWDFGKYSPTLKTLSWCKLFFCMEWNGTITLLMEANPGIWCKLFSPTLLKRWVTWKHGLGNVVPSREWGILHFLLLRCHFNNLRNILWGSSMDCRGICYFARGISLSRPKKGGLMHFPLDIKLLDRILTISKFNLLYFPWWVNHEGFLSSLTLPRHNQKNRAYVTTCCSNSAAASSTSSTTTVQQIKREGNAKSTPMNERSKEYQGHTPMNEWMRGVWNTKGMYPNECD